MLTQPQIILIAIIVIFAIYYLYTNYTSPSGTSATVATLPSSSSSATAAAAALPAPSSNAAALNSNAITTQNTINTDIQNNNASGAVAASLANIKAI